MSLYNYLEVTARCPHCGTVGNAHAMAGKSTRPGLYKCNACRTQFSVTVGTVFESSKVKLHLWLQACYLMSASKKGISAKQLERMLGVTYKTAWFMCHRIREAMDQDSGPLGGSREAGRAIRQWRRPAACTFWAARR